MLCISINFSLHVCWHLFMYGAPILGAFMLTIVKSSSCIDPFIILQCSSLSFYGLCFKVYFDWYENADPCFFCHFSLHEVFFFHLFTFNLCVFFAIKCVPCRQHIVGSWVFVCFNPVCPKFSDWSTFHLLTFKVNTDNCILPF